MKGVERWPLVVVAVGLLATPAQGQVLLQPSFTVGTAIPVRDEGRDFGNGIHIGAGLKLALIPVQLEAALDRMGAEDDAADDLTVWSIGVALPVNLTPGLLPIGPYLIGGGGLYRHAGGDAGTNAGLTAGAGLRVGIPGLSLFVEGRGVGVLSDDKLTWITLTAGLRL